MCFRFHLYVNYFPVKNFKQEIASIFFILCLTALAFPQEKTIKIIAITPDLPTKESVFITGESADLGAWNRMMPMSKVSENRWQFILSANKGDTLRFKFNRGDWSTEAVDSNGIEYENFSYIVKKDTSISYTLLHWRDQVYKKIVITPERLKNKSGWFELYEGWKYKTGDDSTWAVPSFNDNGWKTINPILNKEDFEKIKWTGNIWFRNHIFIDSTLWNKPFGFHFINTGAAEVYLDGKLLYKFGIVGHSRATEKIYIDRDPKIIVFGEKEEHLLAVRYSNHYAEEMIQRSVRAGFEAIIGDNDRFISDRVNNVRQISILQMAFSTFILAFAIMHFLLFIFYPKAKENLFYSISMLSFAVVTYTAMQNNFVTSIMFAFELSTVNSIAVQMSILFGLLTVYASSYTKMPKQYIIFVIISMFFVFQTIFFPTWGGELIDYVFYLFAIILTAELIRIVIRSIIKKEPWGWAWIVGAGFIVAMIFIAYQILVSLRILPPPFGIYLVYVYGIVFLAITVSINLSKKISDTNRDLEKQLVQIKELSNRALEQERKAKDEELARKLLEADNQRKTLELEEARSLQLSMLPKEIPSVKNMEIAVYMKPATEVGGDYYDFKQNNNGSLTIAIGDATGHGMKAGTLVATIKGLFSSETTETDIVRFFSKCNSVIRDMHLGNLYMALLLAKIENDSLTFSSAGMPPVLIYRNKTKQVEELRMQGLPLGGSAGFEYSQRETNLSGGDTLLLMSDGFPELFNKEKEILDYDQAKNIFASVAELAPEKIIRHLNDKADKWRGGAIQEDDITFVVVQIRKGI